MDRPLRKAMLIVVVAALTATAGCNLGGSGDGLQPRESLNGSQLTTDTAATVSDAGSYTREVDAVITTNGTSGESRTAVTLTTRANFETERGIRATNQSIRSGTFESTNNIVVYTDGNTSYRRQNSSIRGLSYARQSEGSGGSAGINPVNVTGFQQTFTNVTNLTAAFDWEANGTATVGDTETIRYSSTNLTDASRLLAGASGNVSSASAEIYLDANGTVRRVDIVYTRTGAGGSSTADLSITLTDIGATTVEEPGWLSAAQGTETAG